MQFLRRTLTIFLLWAAAFPAAATFHLWSMVELYSSADGSVQFLEFTTSASGQQFLNGHTLKSVSGAVTHNFTFNSDLPGDTAGHRFLVGTAGYAALSGVPAPDYIVPNGFFFPGGGTITFGEGANVWTHGPTPAPNLSLNRNGSTAVNSPRNFAGQTGVIGGGGLTTATISLAGPTTSMQGTTVTFTATVTGNSPTGTVQFKDGGSNLGSAVTLAGSVAARSVSTLSVGMHTISAVYSGDGANTGATSNNVTHTVSANAPPPPPPSGGASTKTLGSRATVSPTATLFGGFELAESSLVYILVRGNSLGTLGVTQGFLDAPRVRLYNAQGQDIVLEQGGRAGFNGCSASSASAAPVVTFYQTRGIPASDRDACIAQTLAPGAYTFTVTPSLPGVTTDAAVSTPSTGEVLFEVSLGGGGESIAKTLGSRATVAQAATLFGGFEIASNSVVLILVRGNSLGTLGVTQSFLDEPRVRLFDGQGHDLITDPSDGPGSTLCRADNSTQKPVVDYYNLTRHQPVDGRDACLSRTLAPGVYTFTVTPNASSAPPSGEVLFEVTLSP
jgi:hypothetical protein